MTTYEASEPLYDPTVLRTIFLEFENEDWETELEAFKPTDVEVPAVMTVDGQRYPNVGVSFRGASSFGHVPAGNKRSFNISMDFVDDDQRLYGYKTLNLLNCNGDASMMSSYLYHQIASQKIATPKVNFVKVVVNGESWGVYANAQQFNKDFLKENYDTKKGARWKVSGSPRGDGGLRYLGDDIEPYRERFEIKSKDDPQAWSDLIELCKRLQQAPIEKLDTELADVLDLDGVLWFLAVDVALINSDGYWTRASDYSIFQDPDGRFHILPHDMNEAFRPARGGPGGGPGGPRGPGGSDRPGGPDRLGGLDRLGGPGGPERDMRPVGSLGGLELGGGPPMRFERDGGNDRGEKGPRREASGAMGYRLDPLVNIDNDRFPLRSRLLQNDRLRTRYLEYVRLIARDHLDWERVGDQVALARDLIGSEVEADTRKLMTDAAFRDAVDPETGDLREFCESRREYLLSHPAIVALD